jgi:predicted ArsR family transcriptional regulator
MFDLGATPIYQWEDPEKYELLAWVKASKRRVEILESLAESPKNTNDFADEWGVTLEAVRYHLEQLQRGGPDGDFVRLVHVLTPQRKQYRLYGLTETGTEVVEYL